MKDVKIYNPYNKQDPALRVLNNLDKNMYHLFGHDIIYKNNREKVVKNFHILSYEKLYSIIKNSLSLSEELVEFNSRNVIKNYYEYYTNSEPIKLFLDIDCKIGSETKYKNIDELVYDVLLLINPILKKLGYEKSAIIVLNASTKEKLSAHIIFPK